VGDGLEALPLALERFFIVSLKNQVRIVTGLTAVAKVARCGSPEVDRIRPGGRIGPRLPCDGRHFRPARSAITIAETIRETDHEDHHEDSRGHCGKNTGGLIAGMTMVATTLNLSAGPAILPPNVPEAGLCIAPEQGSGRSSALALQIALSLLRRPQSACFPAMLVVIVAMDRSAAWHPPPRKVSRKLRPIYASKDMNFDSFFFY
jgi:hypothetical protein